jgi:ribonuclease P protein component
MKKRYRIKKNSEIDAIFKQKKVKGDSFFSVYQIDDTNELEFKYAISIGKKYGNAVSRNLAKRRIRMIILSLKKDFSKNKRFVVVVKPSAKELEFVQMKEKLVILFKKSKLTEITHE